MHSKCSSNVLYRNTVSVMNKTTACAHMHSLGNLLVMIQSCIWDSLGNLVATMQNYPVDIVVKSSTSGETSKHTHKQFKTKQTKIGSSIHERFFNRINMDILNLHVSLFAAGAGAVAAGHAGGFKRSGLCEHTFGLCLPLTALLPTLPAGLLRSRAGVYLR